MDSSPRDQADSVTSSAPSGRVGFSPKIKDPAFARYVQKSNRWAAVFSIVLAIAAFIGFTIYGETSTEVGNPQSMYIGLAIGSMFILIAIFQIICRKRSKTWDGVVVDKKVERKRRRQNTGDDDYYWEEYTLYSVIIRSQNNKLHSIRVENNDSVYNYYKVGDRVRHHGGLNSYEKFDKSQDTKIFCNACATINDINASHCRRCKCPLLN